MYAGIVSAAMAALPAFAQAATPSYVHQQWVCKPGDTGEWQCAQQDSQGRFPKLAVPAILQRKNSGNTTAGKNLTAINPHKQWDWVDKSQLEDPANCDVGCSGDYVAPTPEWPEADQDPDSAPMRATAGSSNIDDDIITLSDKVSLSQGNRNIRADQATLDRSTDEMQSQGNVEVREPNLLIRADSATINTETNLGHFDNALFLHHESGSRGTAQRIVRANDTSLDLEQGSFTQCTPDDETWIINASNIHLDNEEGWGSAKNASLRIADVPVFYVPYITFPIDDRRKSGFLFPTLASGNSNGFELSTPYYFNLAPDYDATLAPRYIEKRGTMLEAELRHLNQFGAWSVSGAQINDDQFSENPAPNIDDDVPPQENRWLGNVTHSGNIRGISTLINYSKVSDVDFFSDFSTDSLELKRNKHLNQQATLGYRNDDWQIDLTAQQYQTIDELLTSQYKLMPQLNVERNYSGANFETEWLLKAEFTDFQHDESIGEGGQFVTGERVFGEAGISYPMRWAAGFVIPTAKIRNVSYKLDDYQANADDSPSVSTPLATIDMGLVFERTGSRFTQTLEPRLYYFYSDYEEQFDNPNFDTKELTFSYSQLFRDTRFSGHDRLDDANQTSIGITSRFIDNDNGREVLTLSLGQIFYLQDRRVQLGSITPADTLSNSSIATEIQYQPTDNLWLSNSLLWDSREDKLEEGGLGFHYQGDNNSLYNIGYRYRREGGSRLYSETTANKDLSQADASVVLPISDRWSVFARYRYDVEENRSLDDLFGIQYDDCCWMVRLLYQQNLDDEYRDELAGEVVVERDYAFILEFQLKGLGSLGRKANGLLKESILGYEDLD